jgi:hypothetical protein
VLTPIAFLLLGGSRVGGGELGRDALSADLPAARTRIKGSGRRVNATPTRPLAPPRLWGVRGAMAASRALDLSSPIETGQRAARPDIIMTVPMPEGLYEQLKHYRGVTPAVKIGGGGVPAEQPESGGPDAQVVRDLPLEPPEPKPVRLRIRRRWWQRIRRRDVEIETEIEEETEVWLDDPR